MESPEGDFLRVVPERDEVGFAVYKLVWLSKNPKWGKVMSLGDVALFLGDSESISVTSSDFSGCQTSDSVGSIEGCQPNSIYFCTVQFCIVGSSKDVHMFAV